MASQQGKKCVMILDGELPAGLSVNAAAVLAVTLGHKVEDLVGLEVVDGSGNRHIGLVTIPIPILKADAEGIRETRAKATEIEEILVVDLTNVAQSSKTYEEYTEKMAAAKSGDLSYLGLALYGDKKPVNKLTGGLPLLR